MQYFDELMGLLPRKTFNENPLGGRLRNSHPTTGFSRLRDYEILGLNELLGIAPCPHDLGKGRVPGERSIPGWIESTAGILSSNVCLLPPSISLSATMSPLSGQTLSLMIEVAQEGPGVRL